jgi:hypothetical protein
LAWVVVSILRLAWAIVSLSTRVATSSSFADVKWGSKAGFRNSRVRTRVLFAVLLGGK